MLQESCSLTGMLQIWYSSVNCATNSREKETLKIQDAQYAKAFAKKPPAMLQPEGMNLKSEATAQVDYIATMPKPNENLPNTIYKLSSCGVDPGMSVVFNKSEELCRQNPNFQSSLMVSLLKSAVAKATPPKGSNIKTDIIGLKLILLIETYDKKSAKVVSANIGGPGDWWVRNMNARE